MLSTVLDRLTSLTSKYFVIGAFTPVLMFAFINGLLLDVESSRFHAWMQSQISATARAFDVVLVFVALAVAAYVLWTLNGFLRQGLEGRRLKPDSFLGRQLRAPQLARLRALRNEYYRARNTMVAFPSLKSNGRDRLVEAAKAGMTDHPGRNDYDGKNGPAALALRKLENARSGATSPRVADLENAITEFEAVLRANDISAVHAATGRKTLSEGRLELLKLLDYAEDEWAASEVGLANRLQARYGTGAVAATALGNVADSLQGYALSRYRLNLETFWSRLQPLLQKQEAFFSVLQDAKTQLDFLTTCVWLSALTTALWFVWLPIRGHSVWLFLAIAIAGPLVTRMFYLSAVESYVALGEVVRTAVDLYRFDLLDALHVVKPQGLRDERALWDSLQRISSFGQEWIDLSYRHGPEAKA